MDLGLLSVGTPQELIVSIVLALIAIALGLRKIHSVYADESVKIAKTNSQLDVITLLREQLKDLATANKELRGESDSLHRVNTALVNDNDDLRHDLKILYERLAAILEACPDCPRRQYIEGLSARGGPGS